MSSSARSRLLAPGSALRRAIEEGHPHSMILHGPPGQRQDDAGPDHRRGLGRGVRGGERGGGRAGRGAGGDRARSRAAATSGTRTIFFLDEIHRFNKAQQDALLPGGRGRAGDADRRHDREPVLRGQLGADLAHPRVRARRAGPRGDPPAARPRRGARRVRARAPARARGARVPGRALGRRRPHGAERARARLRGGRGRRAGHARPRRGRAPAPGAALRPPGRPALRHDLGLDQGHPRLGPRRLALLPRGDARGRRGSTLHRAPDGRARLGGHRQRRSPGAPRRHRGGRRGRARRVCPSASSRSPRRRSTCRWRRSPMPPSDAVFAAREHIRERGADLPPAHLRSSTRSDGDYDNPHRRPGSHLSARS